MKTKITIDAKGITLGRVASQVAKNLMGKTFSDYKPNVKPQVIVEILNAQQTKMTEKRVNKTLYERYSGYPGGFKAVSNKRILDTKGIKELYRLAIYNMLPANKLRAIMMKNLIIKL